MVIDLPKGVQTTNLTGRGKACSPFQPMFCGCGWRGQSVGVSQRESKWSIHRRDDNHTMKQKPKPGGPSASAAFFSPAPASSPGQLFHKAKRQSLDLRCIIAPLVGSLTLVANGQQQTSLPQPVAPTAGPSATNQVDSVQAIP